MREEGPLKDVIDLPCSSYEMQQRLARAVACRGLKWMIEWNEVNLVRK